jgi:hypothetical protein
MHYMQLLSQVYLLSSLGEILQVSTLLDNTLLSLVREKPRIQVIEHNKNNIS